ncbi:MAG: 30S ribosome-binding factor RbfA [Acidimicrobiia bacterium]
MRKHGSPRKYPRMARVNEVVREALGDELERLSDPRLGMVTITGVDVTADLRQATVYYSSLGRTGTGKQGPAVVVGELEPDQQAELEAALKSATPHLRGMLSREVRMKYTPELIFRVDPSIATGNRIDAIIRDLHKDDPDYDPLLHDGRMPERDAGEDAG